MSDRITEEEYLALQSQMFTVAGIVADWKIVQMLEAINTADSVGPLVDPSLWMRGHEHMDRVKQLVIAFKEVQSVAVKMREEIANVESS